MNKTLSLFGIELEIISGIDLTTYRRRHPSPSCLQDENGDIIGIIIHNEPKLNAVKIGEGLERLQYLNLSDNESLQKLEFATALPHLFHLDISDSRVQSLRFDAGFDSLKWLDASRNLMKFFELEGDMPALEYLDLSGNKIKEFILPGQFRQLEYLYLLDNRITNIPKELFAEKTNCAQEVKNYFITSLLTGDILNTQAKIIFFGNGRSGKTTLSHQLRLHEFDPTIEYTHGIKVEEWEIPQKNFPEGLWKKIEREIKSYEEKNGKKLLPPDKIQLQVWDFGGQEYFHATHRLFLNNNVLYLLVWEQTTDCQDETDLIFPKAYWIENIRHHAGTEKNIILQIQNKEEGKSETDHSNLKYKVANRTKANIPQYELDVAHLENGIMNQLPALEYLCTAIPKLYDDIRQELRKQRSKAKYLTYSDYLRICQETDNTKEKIMQDESQIRTLTNFLHDTGSLICYRFREGKKSSLLDDFVFIEPKWVTDTIYQILDEKTLEGKGEFDKIHVVEVLQMHKNPILNANLWLELMTEFELIFKKTGRIDEYIAPQYLPEECQDLSEKAKENLKDELPHQLIMYYPDFLPRSLISRFICKYGNLARDYYWKYGIVVHRNAGEKVLVSCDYKKHQISIFAATHGSAFALELFNTLKSLDDHEKLEVIVSEENQPENLIGPVNLKKLAGREGKEDVEWEGKEYDMKHFAFLFERSKGQDEELPENVGGKRGVIGLDNNYLHEDSNIIDVTMSHGARDYIPFAQIESQIKILFLSATPSDTRQINTGKESRFKDLFRYFDQEKKFNIKEEHGLNSEQFKNFLIYEDPHILHYGGHGEVEGIVLEGEDLDAEILFEILEISNKTQIVVLNACYSLPIAKKLAAIIPYVIGTQDAINDSTAIAFAKGFYMGIVAGKTVEAAFKLGVTTIKQERLSGADIPILLKGIKNNTSSV